MKLLPAITVSLVPNHLNAGELEEIAISSILIQGKRAARLLER